MKGDMRGVIKTTIAASIRVGHWLQDKGYDVAGFDGTILKQIKDESGFYILESRPSPTRRLWGIIPIRRGCRIVGEIWFSNEVRGAHEENWIIEASGSSEHIANVQKLAQMLSEAFDTNIEIRWVDEKDKFERDTSIGCCLF